jgi:hypothetical protein
MRKAQKVKKFSASEGILGLERVDVERTVVESRAPADCCRVLVRRGRTPAPGVRIEFRIMSGPIRFAKHSGKKVTLVTDDRGYCGPSIVFQTRGKAFITAKLNIHQALAFQPYTEGFTDRLSMYAPAEIEAADGKITISLSPTDLHGNPVRNASLVLSATNGERIIAAAVRRRGNLYHSILETHHAGCWTVFAADVATGAQATTCVQVLPDPAFRLRVLGDPDPRVIHPYNEALVRTAVLDRFGNYLDPRTIRGRLGRKPIEPHALVGVEAQFKLDATGCKTLNLEFTVAGTRIRRRLPLLCAAAWIGNPGLVVAGRHHHSPLFLTPLPGRKVNRATVKISYDPEQASYERFVPNELLGIKADVEHTAGQLNVSISWKKPLTCTQCGEGLRLGYLDWQCCSEGQTCVSVVAAMSDDTPPWEKCTSQKRPLRKDVCVNFIYDKDDLTLDTARIEKRLDKIYNDDDTIKTCCPFIHFNIHATGYDTMDWLVEVLGRTQTHDTTGSGTLNNPDSGASFGLPPPHGTTAGVRAHCVNFYLVHYPPGSNKNGDTHKGPRDTDPLNPTGQMAGFGVIDPDRAYTDTVAHELGHALGLDHDPPPPTTARDPDELMYPYSSARTDTKIKRPGDCKTIWETIAKY